MITFAAFAANASSRYAVDQFIQIGFDIYHAVNVGKSVQSLRLRYRTRKAVQKKTVFAVAFFDALLHYFHDYFVGNKLSAIDIRLGFKSDGRAFLDVFAEYIAGRNVRNAHCRRNTHRLSSLARAGRSQ